MSGGTVWVSVASHRARAKLRAAVGNPGHSYGISTTWPPRGEYYEVPAGSADRLRAIKGLHVLAGAPGRGAELFRYLTSAELGGPA